MSKFRWNETEYHVQATLCPRFLHTPYAKDRNVCNIPVGKIANISCFAHLHRSIHKLESQCNGTRGHRRVRAIGPRYLCSLCVSVYSRNIERMKRARGAIDAEIYGWRNPGVDENSKVPLADGQTSLCPICLSPRPVSLLLLVAPLIHARLRIFYVWLVLACVFKANASRYMACALINVWCTRGRCAEKKWKNVIGRVKASRREVKILTGSLSPGANGKGKVPLSGGWGEGRFERYQDSHPDSHPRYSLRTPSST